jgi:serine/threonine protein kinase
VEDVGAGTAIAGFRVEAVIGRGAMGTVYAAQDLALERRVALKILAPQFARDDRFRERFLRESKLAASLEHPHILPVHAAGEFEGQLYLAMRYVEGRDLSVALASLGRLAPERTQRILGQIADALDAAHARGLVHRDVKPANILLAADDYAYLCDFGLAKHTSTAESLTGDRACRSTAGRTCTPSAASSTSASSASLRTVGRTSSLRSSLTRRRHLPPSRLGGPSFRRHSTGSSPARSRRIASAASRPAGS